MKVEVDLPPGVVDILRERYGYRYASWFVRDACRKLLKEYGLIE